MINSVKICQQLMRHMSVLPAAVEAEAGGMQVWLKCKQFSNTLPLSENWKGGYCEHCSVVCCLAGRPTWDPCGSCGDATVGPALLHRQLPTQGAQPCQSRDKLLSLKGLSCGFRASMSPGHTEIKGRGCKAAERSKGGRARREGGTQCPLGAQEGAPVLTTGARRRCELYRWTVRDGALLCCGEVHRV